jgi:hypothetical protein
VPILSDLFYFILFHPLLFFQSELMKVLGFEVSGKDFWWVDLIKLTLPSLLVHYKICDESLPSFAVSTLVSSHLREQLPQCRTLYIPPLSCWTQKDIDECGPPPLVRWAESGGWHDASWKKIDLPLDVWIMVSEWVRWKGFFFFFADGLVLGIFYFLFFIFSEWEFNNLIILKCPGIQPYWSAKALLWRYWLSGWRSKALTFICGAHEKELGISLHHHIPVPTIILATM